MEAAPARNGATVSFQYPYDDGGAPITSYTATAHPGDASCTTETTSCKIAGLTNGQQYVVTATDNNGVASPARAFSNHFFAGVVPTIPSIVRAALSRSSASITWQTSTSPAGEPVLRYLVQIRAKGGEHRKCVTKATSCAVGGLVDGRKYRVFVSAIDASGESLAGTIEFVSK